MLDPWIIEEIRKREDGDRWEERPVLEIPLNRPDISDSEDQVVRKEEEIEQGVTIVDFRV